MMTRVAMYGRILLLSFISSSIAKYIPESDLPFEFNYKSGSVVTGNNVLTQSVSSNGQEVLKVNDPQPIKKYHSKNIVDDEVHHTKPYTEHSKTIHTDNGQSQQSNKQSTNVVYSLPVQDANIPFTFSPTSSDIWEMMENLNRLQSRNSNFRFIYI